MRPLAQLYRSMEKFMKIYLKPIWVSPTGPRTIYFWAPIFKWGVVLSEVGEVYHRPSRNISKFKSMLLTVSGIIWSRWSFTITPKNYNLLACSSVLGLTQFVMLLRGIHYSWRTRKNV